MSSNHNAITGYFPFSVRTAPTFSASTYHEWLKCSSPMETARSFPDVKKIRFQDNTTTVFWHDNTITTVRCGKGEVFDRYAAFTAAICKKLYGSTSAVKKLIARLDEAEIQRKKKEEIDCQNEALRRKKEKRERSRIKRRAKAIVLEQKAQALAAEMVSQSASQS